MSVRTRYIAAAIAAMAVGGMSAAHADGGNPKFRFSGFGTLGAVRSSLDTADFVAGFQPNGAGATRKWATTVDSRLGGQVDAQFTNKLSAVVQLVSEQQWNNSYNPIVEWANVKYEFTPDLSVRVGRIALATYLISDTRKVGYVNTLVRVPPSFYAILPITNSDGIDASYRFHSGNVVNTTTLYYGSNEVKLADGFLSGARAKANEVIGVVNNTEYGATTFHAAYHEQKLTIARLGMISAPFKLYTLGANYDPGNWFLMGEAALDKLGGRTDRFGAYVLGGYRIGDFTPYAGYTKIRQITPIFGDSSQTGPTLGMRWNFAKNAAFKLQYERVNLGKNSAGTMTLNTPTADFQNGSNFTLISAAVDFVF